MAAKELGKLGTDPDSSFYTAITNILTDNWVLM